MAFQGIPRETLTFLAGLSRNNEKAWFDAHREDYERFFMTPARELVMALAEPLRTLSPSVHAEPKVNGSIMRINRDIRFSKNKSPYKDHLDLWFWDGPEKNWGCSGFFFRLTPKVLMLGGGMHHFERQLLERYRHAVVHPKKGARLLEAVHAVKKAGYEVGGSEYKRPPKGFTTDNERAPLLLHGGLFAGADVPVSKAFRGPGFVSLCLSHYKKLLPLHRWLVKDLLG
jgi:uncharacterized protein (TIGR02453 family)